MGLWRDFLRLLGLSGDARVHISAPGIDVVITGEPEQVRSLLGVVKYELERSARWRDRRPHSVAPHGADPARRPASAAISAGGVVARSSSQYVQPTELDEMDSPYALPDPLVMPVEDTTGERERPTMSPERAERERVAERVERERAADRVERTDRVERAERTDRVERADRADRPRDNGHRYLPDAATLVPDIYDTREDPALSGSKGTPREDASRSRPILARNESTPAEVGSTKIDSKPPPPSVSDSDDHGDREVTAIAHNPSGPQPVQLPHGGQGGGSLAAPAILRSSSPFVTDGGPTLTPSISDPEVAPLKRSTGELRNTDPDGDETKETTRREN